MRRATLHPSAGVMHVRPLPDTPAPFAVYAAHEFSTPLATQPALLELALPDPDADTAAWRDVGNDVLKACKQRERMLDVLGRFSSSG
jgi:hypothetical protein